MSKMVKIMKNKLMIAAMVAVMVFGTAMVPVHAAAVETNYYGGGATYTYYIRKSGSSAELGYMRITRTKSAITNTFTASNPCDKVTLWIRESSTASSVDDSIDDLVQGNTFSVSKNGRNYTAAYGKGRVEY